MYIIFICYLSLKIHLVFYLLKYFIFYPYQVIQSGPFYYPLTFVVKTSKIAFLTSKAS